MTTATRPTGKQSGDPRTRALLTDLAGSVRSLLARPLTPYYIVLGATVLLTVMGLVMVLSASSIIAYVEDGSSYAIAQKQAIWLAIGLPLMVLATRAPVKLVRALTLPALVVVIVLLCLVLVPGIGVSVNGNQNWIAVGSTFRIQPSEAAKLVLVVWGADLLVRKRKLLNQWKHLLVPFVPVSGIVIALVLLGGDLGTALILMAIVGGLLFLVGAPVRLFVGLGATVALLVGYLVVDRAARLSRIQDWLHPFNDYQGGGWQGAHGLLALASGGWWGVGLGASREKWPGALPEAHTDFILAVIGEELGLVGTLTVLALFSLLIYGAVRIAVLTEDPFVRLVSGGVVVWLASQMVVNVGAVTGLLPIAGVPLPLVSYGGSALVPTLVALGLLLSFARELPGAPRALAARRRWWGRPGRPRTAR
jgi:cell division protein FtsW